MSKTLVEKQEVVCPICHGTGVLPEPLRSERNTGRKQQMVKVLVDTGFSYREVAKFLGYKSPNSVTKVLKEKEPCKKKSPKKKPVS
jgi:putative intracellular protease/amidase